MSTPSAEALALARSKLDASLATPVVRDFLRLRLVEWQPGAVTLSLDCRPELGHRPGWFQGAVTTAIAEHAAGMSGVTLAADRDSMTLQQNIHFTGPAQGSRLVARGRVVSAGYTISTCVADILVERDGALHPCATLTMVMSHRKPKTA